jgi:Rhs element Vgr protein
MVPFLYISVGQARRLLTVLQPIWFSVEHRVNVVPSATLSLTIEGNSLQLGQSDEEVGLCQPGNIISISIEENEKTNQALIFSGVIVGLELELEKESATLTLKLRHQLAALESTCRSQVFSDMSASDIISRFFREQNIKLLNTAEMKTKQEQLIQFRCSDWLYIRRLLDEKGAWLLPEPDGVKIIQPKLAASAERTLKQSNVNAKSNSDGSDEIFQASWQFNDQYQPKELKLTAWDIAEQKAITARAAPEALGQQALNPGKQQPLNDTPWVMGSSISVTQKELNAMANSALQHLQEAGVQGTFKIVGADDYKLGQTLALVGFGRSFDGSGIITAIAHNINKTEWTTEISLGMKSSNVMITPLPPVVGLHIGVISDFKKDPNNLERMRVSLPVLGDTANVVWARLALPYASKDSGFAFYPELGNEVVVGFFDDDPCFPMIIGSMYNPKNKAPLPITKENKIKGIAFKYEGKELCLQFDMGANSVKILADKDQIDLKGGVVIKSKEVISVESKADISIESNSGIEIKSKKINLVN